MSGLFIWVRIMPMMKNIIIIGCGYIGKKIAGLLKAQSLNPACFVNTEESKNKLLSMGFQAMQFDLDETGLELDEKKLNTFNNSVIAYLAPPQREGIVDNRMAHFVSMLETLSSPPSKIILISTTGVYGDCKGEWIDEQQATVPQADRSHRRLSAETQLKKYCEKVQAQYVVFRVPGIYAADKLPVKRITSGEPIVAAQDSGFTNRIHADDLSAFCVEALTEDVQPGIYNCCDGHPSTMNDYFMKVAQAMKLSPPKEISLQQAQQELSSGMLSYLAESKRISNKKLLNNFKTRFKYPDLDAGLKFALIKSKRLPQMNAKKRK